MLKDLLKRRDPWYGKDSPSEGLLFPTLVLAFVLGTYYFLSQLGKALAAMDEQTDPYEPSYN